MSTLLVTGASGQLGQHVLNHLKASEHTIIAASRDPSKLTTDLETRTIDFDQPDTLAQAFAGVERVLLISTDSIAVKGQRLTQHTAAITAAKAAGVKHIVYTSLPNPVPSSKLSLALDHYGTEQALIASGLDYTILRNNWYAENLLGALPLALETGQWFVAAPEGKIGYIAREDAARAAAAALASPKAAKAIHTLTGPEALSYRDVARLATEITGKPIAVTTVSDDQFAQGLIGAGLPDFVATMLTSAEAAIRAGELDVVTDAVESLTGQAPASLRSVLMAALSNGS